jgi:hypothetical protein
MKTKEATEMKKACFIGIICTALMVCTVFGQGKIDTFRGIRWGEDLSAVPELSVLSESGNTKICARNGEQNKIGEAEVEGIRYHFYKDRLSGVSIQFNEHKNFRLLKDGLLAKYGPGSKPNRYLEKYNWVLGDLWIILNFSELQKKGAIYYYYRPISNEMLKDEKEAGQKAKDGL